ncbi:MAG: hypothetical protein ABJA79_11220 [Parafilimonas sp.]
MKFTTAYYLMLIYSTVMLSPVIPIITDAVSHSFAEAYHISAIHAKYGANHLENELANSASENDNGKNQATVKSEEQVPVHISTDECIIDFSFSITSESFQSLKPCSLSSIFIGKQIPPPKFS